MFTKISHELDKIKGPFIGAFLRSCFEMVPEVYYAEVFETVSVIEEGA